MAYGVSALIDMHITITGLQEPGKTSWQWYSGIQRQSKKNKKTYRQLRSADTPGYVDTGRRANPPYGVTVYAFHSANHHPSLSGKPGKVYSTLPLVMPLYPDMSVSLFLRVGIP